MKNQLNLYQPKVKSTRKRAIKLIGMCLYNLTDLRISDQVRDANIGELMMAMTNIRRGLDRAANVSNKLQWNIQEKESNNGK